MTFTELLPSERSTRRKLDPVKTCEQCGVQMMRRRMNGRLEDRTAFMRRKYCSMACRNEAYRGRPFPSHQRKTTPAVERVLAKCFDQGGCWVFRGAKSTNGYGRVGLGTRTARTAQAHRVVYEYFIAEIPHGLDLDHLCRNRLCCNPWHLEPVTRQVNALRGARW